MKFHELLHQRDALLRQARLANLAFAHQRLGDFAARIARARLHGEVVLSPADPASDRLWPVLLRQSGHQSVIDEHFTDEDIAELADLLAFVREGDRTELAFLLEELGPRFLPGLRRELEHAGVALDRANAAVEDLPPRPH
jgi:hypothetical protein